MERWRRVWREGMIPSLSSAGLLALSDALRNNDPRLAQGSTTTPPPLVCSQDWPVEAACAVGFCAWQGDGLETVGQVEEYFARCCFKADQLLNEPAACRWFLNWFDDAPRDEMRRALLAEVERALSERAEQEWLENVFTEARAVVGVGSDSESDALASHRRELAFV